MDTNVGSVDRALRFLVGLLLVAMPFITSFALWQSTLASGIAVIVGLVLLATAVFKFCPAYRILGISTCKI